MSIFPFETWRRISMRHALKTSIREVDYGPAAGVPALRDAICLHLVRSRAVVCDSSEVIVVSGAQQALDLVSRILVDRGDTVAIEDPQYHGTKEVLRAAGARLVLVPVDREGMDPAKLPSRAKVVFVTPSHQFPTGAILPLDRRLALIEWAQRRNAVIVENDYDGEFHYGGRPLESLQGLDTHGRTEPLKRLQWPSTVVEFSVIVVLDNHRISALSPFDQGKASIKRKNRTCWKLMRWRHKDDLGPTGEFRRIHTLPIDRHRHQASASGAKDLFGPMVLRVFDCYRIAAVDKYPGDQIEGLLGTADDNDLRRVAHYRSGAPQMQTDCIAQCRYTSGRAVVHFTNRCFQRVTHRDAPPGFERKDRHVASAKCEVISKPGGRTVGEFELVRCLGYCGTETRERQTRELFRSSGSAS